MTVVQRAKLGIPRAITPALEETQWTLNQAVHSTSWGLEVLVNARDTPILQNLLLAQPSSSVQTVQNAGLGTTLQAFLGPLWPLNLSPHPSPPFPQYKEWALLLFSVVFLGHSCSGQVLTLWVVQEVTPTHPSCEAAP